MHIATYNGNAYTNYNIGKKNCNFGKLVIEQNGGMLKQKDKDFVQTKRFKNAVIDLDTLGYDLAINLTPKRSTATICMKNDFDPFDPDSDNTFYAFDTKTDRENLINTMEGVIARKQTKSFADEFNKELNLE